MLLSVIRGLAATGLVCAFALSTNASAASYSFQTIEPSNQIGAQVWGINNAGLVLGGGMDGTPFVYQAGVYSIPAGLAGAVRTHVFGATTSGAILGNSVMSEVLDEAGEILNQKVTPFVYAAGSFSTLAGLPAADFYQARSISSNGRFVAGMFAVGENSAQAPLQGFAVDRATGQGFSLGVPSGLGGNIVLHGVNDAGIAVGDWTYLRPEGVVREAILWDFAANSLSSFTLAGYSKTAARGIDSNGTIAGWVRDSAGVQHGFLRGANGDQIIDMPGASGTAIEGLNDHGQLVGIYYDANGLSHGFLATPVPEPTTAGMLLAGLLGLLGLQRRRKAPATR